MATSPQKVGIEEIVCDYLNKEINNSRNGHFAKTMYTGYVDININGIIAMNMKRI